MEEATAIFELIEAWPRFKDTALDPMRTDGGPGALLLRGPSKLLQTLAKVTQANKAPTTAERFKMLLSRSKWLGQQALLEELASASGLKGLADRLERCAANECVVVVAMEEAGEDALRCAHNTCLASTQCADSGPWLYVLDHGQERTGRRPGFSYNGTVNGGLKPYRVGPDRPVPEGVVRPDYYVGGDPVAERSSDAKNVPPVLTPKQQEEVRRACRLGREILDAAHRTVRVGATTDEIDRVVHEYTVEHGAYPAPLHYINFPKSVCTSVNEARRPRHPRPPRPRAPPRLAGGRRRWCATGSRTCASCRTATSSTST